MGERTRKGDGSPPDREADLDALRAILLARVEARRGEVEEAIVAANLEIEPRLGADPDGMAGLEAAAAETVELVTELIAEGVEWTPRIPAAVAAQARYAARHGVALEVVMRGHYATTSLCFEFALSEISELPGETLPYLLEIQSRHGDHLMRSVSAEYEAELERLGHPSVRRLEERIERLLAGEDAGGPLGYELDGWHLGLIAVGPDTELVLRWLAERLGARLLFLPKGAERAWAWLGSTRRLSFAELERWLRNGDAEVSLVAGESRPGPGGWRLTHTEAELADDVSRHAPGALVRCADVLLLAAATRSPQIGRILLDVYLGPLDTGKEGETLRGTLRAYYASDGNSASAAAALGVDRQTVRRRLHRVEELLDRRLDGCRAEIETALRLEEHRGPLLDPGAAGAHAT
ncbi:MAG TPA: helix-turn-helix domain-containing protein [Solirubrobacterales bacterium]|nr:helix-turn-helix domain-containing protein [Solirubrobacterales bacterium]